MHRKELAVHELTNINTCKFSSTYIPVSETPFLIRPFLHLTNNGTNTFIIKFTSTKSSWHIHAMPERMKILFPYSENHASVEILKLKSWVSILNRLPCPGHLMVSLLWHSGGIVGTLLTAVAKLLAGSPMPDWSKVLTQMKMDTLLLHVGLWDRDRQTHPVKRKIYVEKKRRKCLRRDLQIHDDLTTRMRESS